MMASTHILAVGKIVDGAIEMQIAMPPWPSQELNEWERMVVDEPQPEPQYIAPLQDMIDYGAELEALQDGMEDDEWHRRGEW